MPTVFNGQRRPNLSDQINRLDRILDGLADGLNEAVATAVSAAVTIAVREATETVLRELLLRHSTPTVVAVAPPPTLMARSGQCLKRSRVYLAAILAPLALAMGRASGRIATVTRRATATVQGFCLRVGHTLVRRATYIGTAAAVAGVALWRARFTAVPASVIGAVVTCAAYLAGPGIASALCGLAATCLTMVTGSLRRGWHWATAAPAV